MSPRPAPLDLTPRWREHKPEEWAEEQFHRIPEERGHIELELPRSTGQRTLNLGQVLQVGTLMPGMLGSWRGDHTEPNSLK